MSLLGLPNAHYGFRRRGSRRAAPEGLVQAQVGQCVGMPHLAAEHSRIRRGVPIGMKLFGPTLAITVFLMSLAGIAPSTASPLIQIMQGDLGQSRPSGCPSRWCACYLDKILTEAGLQPRGSNRARDFATYGKPAKPAQFGAIMVMRNHVGVVTGQCPDGRVQIISGNYSRKVLPGCYSAARAIAWRRP
jgi:uncharacterized protein (TIGR02594 family)